MKKFPLKPSFELIFALSLIVIMALPPIVFGQTQKDLNITIRNGDTVINGKNIKDLSATDRQQAMKDITSVTVDGSNSGERNGRMMQHRRMMNGNSQDVIIERRMFHDDAGPMANRPRIKRDSAHLTFRYKFKDSNGKDSVMAFNFRDDRMPPPADMNARTFRLDGVGRMPGEYGRRGMGRRNTLNFNYTTTNADGITTHTTFNVAEPWGEDLKRISGGDKNDLELTDLTLVPEYAAGKILLMFDLSAKSTAEIKFMDSEGKLLWSEKAIGGSIKKSFPLGLNGIYYLEVKQAGKVAVRKIVKD